MEQLPVNYYTDRFLKILEGLNSNQRHAVEQVEGPMLVVAGPGTGKTHMLAARIGVILLETDTPASSILCLTFTEAGVSAMRERLLDFIGPEAHRVRIFTFHSFCNAVIQDNPEYFGWSDLEAITELEKIDLIRNLLSNLDLDHPLRKIGGAPFFYERHLLELFSTMKQQNWRPDQVRKEVADYLESLPQRPEYQYKRKHGEFEKGDLKAAHIEAETQRMVRLQAAAELYESYEKAKRAARRYDFDDMIHWVLKAFKEHEQLLRLYQERFLYLLVDEYQDTNSAQNSLLLLLASYWEHPNLFIVGDDDQSIYEFQGARLYNLMEVFQTYRDSMDLVVLNENYRSSPPILSAAGQLIGQNDIRLLRFLPDLKKELFASHPDVNQLEVKPLILEYTNRTQELAGLLKQMRELKEKGTSWSEMAVIYARHRQAEPLIDLMERQGLPYAVRKRINVMDENRVQQIRDLLEYLAIELERPTAGEALLFRILHFDFWGIQRKDLESLAIYRAQQASVPLPAWSELIGDVALHEVLRLPSAAALRQAGETLRTLISDAVNLPLSVFLERVINLSGLLKKLYDSPDNIWQTQVLSAFFNFTNEAALRSPRLSLRELLDQFNRMDANGIYLPLEKIVELEEGVQLVTAHSAKGLEFEHVFIFDAVSEFWEPGQKSGYNRFKLPDTLTRSGEADALEARRRLFYVGMTRAKRGLYVSYSRRKNDGKELQPAIFVQEIAPFCQVRQGKPAEEDVLAAQQLQLRQKWLPQLPARNQKQIEGILKNFRLSISALNSYLDCPLSFYFGYIIKAPVSRRASAVYGSAMHNALQRLFDRMMRSRPRQFSPEAVLIDLFEEELLRKSALLSPFDLEQYLEKGRRRLRAYYRKHYGAWPRRVVAEYNIRTTEVEGIPLTGTIDRIDFKKQGKVEIVDYKTGALTATKWTRPSVKKPEGGAFWRQLVFYKLMYESFDREGRIVDQATVSFLEPDARGQFVDKTFRFLPEDGEQFRKILQATYSNIQAQRFYEGCGKKECLWCNFVKGLDLPARLGNAAVDELDDNR